jgi:predicted chitinase
MTNLKLGCISLMCIVFASCAGEVGEELEETEDITSSVTSGITYTFRPASSPGRCLDVTSRGTTNGTSIQQWDCNGSGAQSFRTDDLGGGAFRIVNTNSNKCVDVTGVGTADGTKLQLWTCHGGPAQRFRMEDLGNGNHRIVNTNSNKCVDVPGASTANGAKIQIWTCNNTNAQRWTAVEEDGVVEPPPPPPPGGEGIAGVVSESLFNQMFPNRNHFYTYQGLVSTAQAYRAFANSSDMTLRKREAAAFLANIGHETGDLRYVEEINRSNIYCSHGACGGCPAGERQYYGRGPIQLTWNCNYLAAGRAIGLGDRLWREPWLVAQDASIAWKTGVWFWMTSSGAGSQSAHAGINGYGSGKGFGETIRTINGSLECNGRNAGAVQSRINRYRRFCDLLGVSYGDNLSC